MKQNGFLRSLQKETKKDKKCFEIFKQKRKSFLYLPITRTRNGYLLIILIAKDHGFITVNLLHPQQKGILMKKKGYSTFGGIKRYSFPWVSTTKWTLWPMFQRRSSVFRCSSCFFIVVSIRMSTCCISPKRTLIALSNDMRCLQFEGFTEKWCALFKRCKFHCTSIYTLVTLK